MNTSKIENEIDEVYYKTIAIGEFLIDKGGYIDKQSYLKLCEVLDLLEQVKNFWMKN